ncbi:MAG: hypothetical protein AAF950_07105 [Pseudomonadota bacterium]
METTIKYRPADILPEYLGAKTKCDFEHAMDKAAGKTSVRSNEHLDHLVDLETDLACRIAEAPASSLEDLEAKLIVASHGRNIRIHGDLTTAGDAIESALLSIRHMMEFGRAAQ